MNASAVATTIIAICAPTPTALRKIFAICEKFVVDFCIRLNCLKTTYFMFIPIRNTQWLSSSAQFRSL